MPARSYAQWLNPAAFARPDPGAYGTMALDAIQGPHRWNVDVALSRSFSMGARQVQVRLEAFNLLNHTNFRSPNGNRSAGAFGTITSTFDPRQLQLGFKLLW